MKVGKVGGVLKDGQARKVRAGKRGDRGEGEGEMVVVVRMSAHRDRSREGKGKKKSKKVKDGEEGKEKEDGKKKKKDGKKKASKKEVEKDEKTKRHSTSSFEVGALNADVNPGGPLSVASKFLGAPTPTRKGQASYMRVGSSAWSVGLAPSPIITSSVNTSLNPANANTNFLSTVTDNRLPVESTFYATRRPSSVLSSSSSLRPLSTTSTNSRMLQVSLFSAHSGNSGHWGLGASVRWAEQGLETVREIRRRERKGREKEGGAGGDDDGKGSEKERHASKEKWRSSEGWRTALIDVLPEVLVRWLVDGTHDDAEEDDAEDEAKYWKQQKERDNENSKRFSYPILTIEKATSDMHGRPDDWDDVIAECEGGSAEGDVGSEVMAGW
ncbi:hypothetical protein CVT25_000828 [Psilocybe cyanescens]|uniref:Uncharacterized protein n=1 Tax=Psilocybe cyanescens TaxID=93625 RepID=A0A409XXR2_PSICY|nr:hypothetical protein CVT25_000828 [Psilocybe cyanescens]